MATAKKNSKNNPDNKTKRKEYKIYDSTHCSKCSDKDKCKEFADYMIKLSKGKAFGCVCKQGK